MILLTHIREHGQQVQYMYRAFIKDALWCSHTDALWKAGERQEEAEGRLLGIDSTVIPALEEFALHQGDAAYMFN